MSRQILAVTLVSQARSSARSAGAEVCSRSIASCTASSASAALPSSR
jgi:hypothetical protein